ERNDLGMYRVVFDFMLARGEKSVRPSNWMRLARPTARTNHFDMPLTPGTEVQVAFIDGNPDRPYIQCALENSTSLITPVSNKNPHHAAILTDGMLKTEALKSRQSLHISGQHSAKEVKAFISSDENKIFEYDSRGKRLNEKIVPEEGKNNIEEREGDRYVRTYGGAFC